MNKTGDIDSNKSHNIQTRIMRRTVVLMLLMGVMITMIVMTPLVFHLEETTGKIISLKLATITLAAISLILLGVYGANAGSHRAPVASAHQRLQRLL